MADMSTLRKKLGRYKLIKATPYCDVSYGDNVLMTELLYRSKSGKLVVKDIYGSYTLEELLVDEPSKTNGDLIKGAK